MDEEDNDSRLTKQSESQRSIFDFSSVEDLRPIHEESDPFPSGRTRPTLPFNESYIAHAPSRHSFTLNSRYTYFGGHGASSKDIGGSVEDLAGYARKMESKRSLGKFSKSSPDLFVTSYQSSDSYDITKQETREDFVMHLDSDFENEQESEHGNKGSTEDGNFSITKPENDPQVGLETEWATEHEVSSQLSALKIENTNRNTTFVGEVKDEVNTTASISEGINKTSPKEANTHVQNPGMNHDAHVSSTAEKKSAGKTYEGKSDIFDKGWKTILHSGKAELRKSLESLHSFRQDMNLREIQNIETFKSENDDSVAMQQSGEGNLEQPKELVEEGSKKYETGMKRNDETAELNTALPERGKRQKISLESEDEISCQTSEYNSSICESDTTVIQQSYNGITTNEDSRWTTLEADKYTKDVVNAKSATTTQTWERTTNGNQEKQAALRIINSQNDRKDMSTSEEDVAAVKKQLAEYASCYTSDGQIFHRNITTSRVRETEESLNTNETTVSIDSVLHMEGTIDETTVDNEGYSRTIVPPSCNISPITLRVLNNSTFCDENNAPQNTKDFSGESASATVKVSGIRQSSICVREDERTADNLEQFLLNSSVETREPNSQWQNNNTDLDQTKNLETSQERDNSLLKNMMGMFCLLGLKNSPEGGFYSNGQTREPKTAKDGVNLEQCVEERRDQTPEDLDSQENMKKKLFISSNDNETISKENEPLIDIETEFALNWEQQDKEAANGYANTKFGDCNNSTVEETNTQQIADNESPAMIEENISDVPFARKHILDELNAYDDKEPLLSQASDTTLYKADMQDGKQEKLVEYLKADIDEGIILQATMTRDLSLLMPEDSEGNSEKYNDTDEFQRKEEKMVEQEMRENDENDLSINAVGLMTTKGEETSISQESTTTEEQGLKISTTILEMNRNKWSYVYIIPPRSHNVNTKNFPAAFNVLVLDKQLIPTSPERNSTVVTLNLFPHKNAEDYSLVQNRELSQVEILVNVEQIYLKADERNPDLFQDEICRNNVEEQSFESNDLEEQNLVELESKSENNFENYFPASDEKILHNTQDQKPKSLEQDDFLVTGVKETVQKVDFKAMTDERLSEQLMRLEMNELVDEKIAKQETTKQENLFCELDEILQPGNEVGETINKEDSRSIQYDLLSELDGFFVSEDMQENETGNLENNEENNKVILSEVDEQIYSQVEMVPHIQTLDERLCSLQSKNEVPETITWTAVQGKWLDLSQLDKVLKPNYVQEIVLDKTKVQSDKQYSFTETDKYFDSLKTLTYETSKEMDYQKRDRLFELPQDSSRLPVPSWEKTIIVTSRVISIQINEEIEIIETEKERGSSDVEEQPIQEKAWEITVNNQEVIPERNVITMASKDSGVSNTNDDLILVIANPAQLYDGDGGGDDENYDDDDDDDDESNGIDNVGDDDDMQYIVSPIPDDLSSVASNYDASGESSSGINGEQSLIDDVVEHTPWDVTVCYANPETMKPEYQLLRASYSNIQPEVYQVENETADDELAVDGKYINDESNSSHVQKHHVHTTMKVLSKPKNEQPTDDNFNIEVIPNGNQYKTTMHIEQHQNQVNTSYVLFQRFEKQDSPKTYFELNYDKDKWSVGEKNTFHEKEPEKTFVVSYATIEHINPPSVNIGYLPTIDEDTNDGDICEIQVTYLQNEREQTKVEFLQSLPPFPTPPQTLSASSSSPLPSPPLLPVSPSASPPARPQSPSSPPLPPPPSSPTSPPESPPARPSSFPLPPPPTQSPPVSPPARPPSPPSFPTSPPPRPPLPLPTTTTTRAGPLEARKEETDLYTFHNSPEISVQQRRRQENTAYPLSPPKTTNKEVNQQVEMEHHSHTQKNILPDELRQEIIQPSLQEAPSTPNEVEIHYNSQENSTPLEMLTETIHAKTPYQPSGTIHSQVPPPVTEERQPVWSFAQSVFHTDGQSKTFFKVIDSRKKSFQSSTFMYRGERVRVSRGVNVFKNYIESSKQDIGNVESTIHGDYDGYQVMHSRENEDYVGYSEIWDEGNQMTVNNEVMVEVDGPMTRSSMAYEMATEQDLFEKDRNCSWHLTLHGSHGVCEISADNFDAIAKEDDNTLLGSKGLVSGRHRWVIQGLGIFCAVGVCYSGEGLASWYKGGKWVWTTDGLMYSRTSGIGRSELGQWRNEDVLEMTLDCEDQKLTIVNTRTNVEASLYGFQREVYPYFNIYKGSCIRLLETS